MNALWEILQGRLVRRGVPTKNLTPGEIERAANDTVRASSRCSRAFRPKPPRRSSSS